MQIRIPLSGCLWLATALGALYGAEFPQAEISNGRIKAVVYLPDAAKGYYRATRFDWSGAIARLECNGHNYFGVWFPKYDPLLNDSITGPVEEFRTGDTALGWEEAKVGGTFIKIGVGVLRKPDERPYAFSRTFEIVNGGKWTSRASDDSVEFTHELADAASGYAYVYRKVVRLAKGEPRMTIEHSLRNTGKRAIETNVYNHNFFMLDNQPSGPELSVKFAFEPKATRDLRGMAEVRGKQLVYLKEIASRQSVFTEFTGFGATASDFDFRVENAKSGAGVRVVGDRPLWKMVFWSIPTVLSPEAYVDMKIEPGAESHWRLTYDFYTLPRPAGN